MATRETVTSDNVQRGVLPTGTMEDQDWKRVVGMWVAVGEADTETGRMAKSYLG